MVHLKLVTTSFYGSSGIVITFPLILEPTYNFKNILKSRPDYQRRNELLNTKLERNNKETQVVWQNMMKEFLDKMIEQPKFQQLIKFCSQKSFDNLTKEMTKIIKTDEMIEQSQSNLKTLGRYTYEAQILSKLKDFSELSSDAQKNCSLLSINIILILHCVFGRLIPRATIFYANL